MKLNVKSEKYRFMPGVEVTPEMAEEWLATSAGNRGLSPVTVRAYAEDMRLDRWHQNGEVIRFDTNGCLRDGHHRLNAVKVANKTVVLDLLLGCEPETLFSIDCGRGRRLVDFLRMPGGPQVDNAFHRAAYLATCSNLLTGQFVPIKTLDAYQRWMAMFGPGVEWALKDVLGHKSIENSPIAGALAFAFKSDPDGVTLFGGQLCSGERLSGGDPALTLRNMILLGRAPGGHVNHDNKLATARKVLNATLAALTGRKLSKVYDTTEGLVHFRKPYLHSNTARDISKVWMKPEVSKPAA